jgi:hypothetical protein
MSDTPTVISFDEARDCPQCSHKGKITQSRPIVGGTLHTLECVNEVCPWYQTHWFVETDSNGEVQVNETAMKASQGTRLIAPTDPSFDATFEGVHEMLRRQQEQETKGGHP